jgi:hypothetical protein
LLDDGRALLGDEKTGAAVARFREATQIDPKQWRVHYLLGSALISTEPDEAVEELTKAWDAEHSEITQHALERAIEARRDRRADGGNLGPALDDLEAATLLGLEKPARAGDASSSPKGPVVAPRPDASSGK